MTWHERVPYAAHPDRCQTNNAVGQCWFFKVEGSDYCLIHGGTAAQKAKKKRDLDMYRLGRYQQRVQELKDDSEIRSLRSEIGILRMLIEDRFNSIQNETELMAHSSAIADMLMKVEKLVSSCTKIEKQLGELLDKGQIVQFGQEVVEIISEYVNSEKLEEVALKIVQAMERKGQADAGSH